MAGHRGPAPRPSLNNMLNSRLQKLESQFIDLEQRLSDPEVIRDQELYHKYRKEHADLNPLIQTFRRYRQAQKELQESQTILKEETDEELKSLARDEIQTLREEAASREEELRLLLLPKDPSDEKDVLLEIRAGTGGEEAGLFAADLFRMYSRLAERQGWKLEILSHSATGIGGLKEIIASISGQRVYSLLKYESGVHRVQRVPVTESQGRIHTSTVTVAVLAEVEEVDVQIPDSDIRVDIYRSAGAGGQNVQKNSTAIRITHLPTGIVVACQDERSQLQNRLRAMAILRARLYEIEQQKRQTELETTRRSQIGTGERSEKIRTYNYPQTRVTDHRVNLSIYNLPAVMDGEIDPFIDELSQRAETERLSGGIEDEVEE